MTANLTPFVVTKSRLLDDFRKAGIEIGDTLCVHTAMSELGYVIGGARTVIEGLIKALGPSGTIMMPTYSGDMSDPAEWSHPPIPRSMIDEVRRELPAYDPVLTPTRGMGAVAELFRHWPEVRRSPHPQSSFSARGKHASDLVEKHPLNFRFGPESPLGKLVDLKGKALLLGAPIETLSLFYLTEYYMDDRRIVERMAPVTENGTVKWTRYRDAEYPCHWFVDVTDWLTERKIARVVRIGNAQCILYDAAHTVRAAAEWRISNRVRSQ